MDIRSLSVKMEFIENTTQIVTRFNSSMASFISKTPKAFTANREKDMTKEVTR